MSKPTHTPEPWRTNQTQDMYSVWGGDDFHVTTMSSLRTERESFDNAKRIVKCVNAMEGIENPEDFMKTVKELELDKYQELKKVVEDVLRLIDEGRELKRDSIIVEALRYAIK
jgi:hypothetical protein